MQKIFKGSAEILKAITDDTIVGVVEICLDKLLHNTQGIDYSKTLCNALVGEKYGYLLEDMTYKVVGFNESNQSIFIEVTASTDKLFIASVLDDWECEDGNEDENVNGDKDDLKIEINASFLAQKYIKCGKEYLIQEYGSYKGRLTGMELDEDTNDERFRDSLKKEILKHESIRKCWWATETYGHTLWLEF